MAGFTCEGFLFNHLMWEDPLLTPIFEVGKYTFNSDFLRWEDTPLIRVTPSAGSLSKDVEEGSFLFLSACSHLASKSIPSLTFGPPLLHDSRKY